jgi:ubiquinone biosynthesis protein UbiJ
LIEKLPASLEETAAVSAVSALLDPIEALALERDALRQRAEAAEERVTELEAANPTPEAYEAACAALHKQRQRAEAAEARWAKLERFLDPMHHIVSTITVGDVIREMRSLESAPSETKPEADHV